MLKNGSRDSEKRAARQGRAGHGAGQGPSVRLSYRAGQGAGPCGKGGARGRAGSVCPSVLQGKAGGRGQIKSKR